MKIGILTYQNAYNYGAKLQEFALFSYIHDYICNDVVVINYNNTQMINSYLNNIKSLPKMNKIKEITKRILFPISYFQSKKRNTYFDNFTKKYIKYTSLINRDKMYDMLLDFNKIVIGSDQVWNYDLNCNDDMYFLPMIDCNKKCTYAVSFGYKEIPNKYFEKTKNNIKTFRRILVRESEGLDILKKLNYNNANVVLDPTFLLDKETWNAKFCLSKPNKKNYALIYCVERQTYLINNAKKYCKEKNLELKIIHPNFNKKVVNAKNIYGISIESFLELLFNASAIFTTSYHGLILAINFNIPVWFELNHNTNRHNSRLENISNIFDLDSQIINNRNQKLEFNKDWKKINKKIDELKKFSVSQLKEIIYE